MRRGRHRELHAHPASKAGQHVLGADRELVATVELLGDGGLALRGPVGRAVESNMRMPDRAEQPRRGTLGQRDGALDPGAPVRMDDPAVLQLEARDGIVELRLGGVAVRAAHGAAPALMGVDELREGHRRRRDLCGDRRLGDGWECGVRHATSSSGPHTDVDGPSKVRP